MDANDIMRRMARNNAWANLRLHRAVGELSETDYRATRTSFFPSLHLTLTHILFNDLFYVGALEHTATIAVWDELERFERDGTFAELRERQRESDLHLIAAAGEGELDAPVQMPRATHVQTDTRGAVLLHLFQHQIHHRGQAHAMLSGTSVKPPQLDEFFLADELPLRAGELRELKLPVG